MKLQLRCSEPSERPTRSDEWMGHRSDLGARRTGPPQLQEGRQGPARHRLAGARPRFAQAQASKVGVARLHQPACGDRRPLPPRLCRGARRRTSRHAMRVRATRPRMVLAQPYGRRRGPRGQWPELWLRLVRRTAHPRGHHPRPQPALWFQLTDNVERLNRTLANQLLDARVFRPQADRRIRLRRWVQGCD